MEIKEIGILAEIHGLPVSLHMYGDAVGLAANTHVAAARILRFSIHHISSWLSVHILELL